MAHMILLIVVLPALAYGFACYQAHKGVDLAKIGDKIATLLRLK